MVVKKFFITAGDVSGDIHAAHLMSALKAQDTSIQFTAVGGPRMQALADNFLCDLASQGITGFVEPIKKIPQLTQLLKKIRTRFETERPTAVIAVDYYGFNYRVLLLAKRYNIPCFYYVTPQVWASRQYRAKRLAALTQKMYVIYPFEPDFHKQFGGNAVFLGNPLLDKIPAPLEKTYPTQDDKNYPWKLGLLPGSRPGEINRLLPVFYQTFKQILEHYPQTHAYLFALREVLEETGYKAVIVRPMIRVKYAFTFQGNYIKKMVQWYLMKKLGRIGKHDASEILAIRWVSLLKAHELVQYPSDIRLVDMLLASLNITPTETPEE